jgi:hypothetical protein
MTSAFNRLFRKHTRVISNEKFLTGFMRQTSHLMPQKANKVVPSKLRELFNLDSQKSDSGCDEMYLKSLESTWLEILIAAD